MYHSLKDIAAELSEQGVFYELISNIESLPIKKLSHVSRIQPDSLAYFDGEHIETGEIENTTFLLKSDYKGELSPKNNYILTDNPKTAFYIVAQKFKSEISLKGIHQTVIIGQNCTIHPTAIIGPYTVIEDNVSIGAGTIIHGNTRIYSSVTIMENVVVEANCSLGASGVFWTWDKNGKMWSLPQLGGVLIKDNCFIGTDVTIVRAAFSEENTSIGEFSKIAHGSKIGHDCVLGKHVHLANNVTLGGNTHISDRCFVGSSATFKAGIRINADNVIGAGAVLTKSFDCTKKLIIGMPAREKEMTKKPTGMNAPLHQIKKE